MKTIEQDWSSVGSETAESTNSFPTSVDTTPNGTTTNEANDHARINEAARKDEYRNQFASDTPSVEALKTALKDLQEQVMVLMADKDDLQNKVKMLVSERDDLQEQREILIVDKGDLQVQVTMQKTDRDGLQEQVKMLTLDRDLAVELLQATLRSETYLEKLDDLTGHDIVNIIGPLVTGSENLKICELKEKAVQFAKTVMNRKSELAVPILASCDKFNALKETDLEETSLNMIRLNPEQLIESCILLTSKRMESILTDPNMDADEYRKFCILEAWTKNDANNENTHERRAIASDLKKHIALDKISPTLLCSNVRNSGLVTDTQLVEAFAKQALLVERKEAQLKDGFAKQADWTALVEEKESQLLEAKTKQDALTALVEQKERQLVEGYAKQADLTALVEQMESQLLEAQTKQDALTALVEQKEKQLAEAHAKQAAFVKSETGIGAWHDESGDY